MYKQKNKEKGVTLIALVVSVIVLIILAGVSIAMLVGEKGIITQAQRAVQETEQAKQNEEKSLQELEGYIDSSLGGETATTVMEARGGKKYNYTTSITDDLKNRVYVPGGFRIAEDSGTKVENGIVIEDEIGNQFVWIPTGIYKTTNGEKTNSLSRRTFTEAEAIEVGGDDLIEKYYYGEGNKNSVAKEQIEAFKISVATHGGFYIGRYEAGTEVERTEEGDTLTTPLVQANKNAYVYVTRDQAKMQSEAMYSRNRYVTGELISSYAWDTALNFICQNSIHGYILATTTNSTYGNLGTNTIELTGVYEADNYSNIHDILGNCKEWTTEYSSSSESPCVDRGGNFLHDDYYAAVRGSGNVLGSVPGYSFRLQLYIK